MDSVLANKLKSSLLTPEDAAILQIDYVDVEELRSKRLPRGVAIKIPYFNVDGSLSGFARYRYMEDTRDSISKLTNRKPIRYLQEKGTASHLYFPPLVDWNSTKSSFEEAIAITEGEFKAACITKHFLPCIGLGGVYSFKNDKLGLPLLDEFNSIVLGKRKIFIVFDNDVHSNVLVARALIKLASNLTNAGAIVFIVDIPPDKDNKIGFDDYASKVGLAAAGELFLKAEQFGINRQLHELNSKLVFIREISTVAELSDTGIVLYNPFNFMTYVYANEKMIRIQYDSVGSVKKTEVSAAKEWMHWKYRREVNKIVIAPGADRIVDNNLNSWEGWGCEPEEGNITPWKELLDHLFEGYPEDRLWFERWLAYPLQHPCSKMGVAVVLWGVWQGTGKTLIGQTIGRIYGKSFHQIDDDALDNPRHEWAEGALFVLGDEVANHERRKSATKLKRLITQDKILIDKKFIPSYEVNDYINYLFTSNDPAAFLLENTDRRFFIHEIGNAPLPSEFYSKYHDWLDNKGSSYLFDYLLNLDLGTMKAGSHPITTRGKENMAYVAKTGVEVFAENLRDTPDAVLRIGGITVNGDLWSAPDLYRFYEVSEFANNSKIDFLLLTRVLIRNGIKFANKGAPLMINGKKTRLLIIRNKEYWETCTDEEEMLVHYEVTHKEVV